MEMARSLHTRVVTAMAVDLWRKLKKYQLRSLLALTVAHGCGSEMKGKEDARVDLPAISMS